MGVENIFDESLARLLELSRQENYIFFNKSDEDFEVKFEHLVSNYIRNILDYKLDKQGLLKDKVLFFAKRVVEHITGDYDFGKGEKTFEEMDKIAESVAIPVGYSDKKQLQMVFDGGIEDVANTVVDGSVGFGLIETEQKDSLKALASFENRPELLKKFFKNSINNIMHLNLHLANAIAKITGMDSKESEEINNNVLGKFIGGLAYDMLSGSLISKRHFVPVQNSNNMQEKIQDEGILHFTSPQNVEKIIESGKLKASNFYISDVTKDKCFFFAGVPKFEDLLINIPAYDVMTAIRIKPTQEQMKELKYRALNDMAVVKDGDFQFTQEQVEIAYFGLQYDKENNKIFLEEISKEEAKDFKVCNEVRKVYDYTSKDNQLFNHNYIRMNAYGLYAEYKHHQNLLHFQKEMERRGIKDFKDVSEKDLYDMTNGLQEATINLDNTHSKTSKLHSIKDFVKMSLKNISLSDINFIGSGIVKDYQRSLERKEGIER